MDRLSDGHDSHWPHGLGDEDDMMDFLTDWVVPHAPAGAVNNLNLQDNSFLDHRPHPQLQYQPSASLPMNIAAPTATNAFSDLASVPQRRPVLDEQATLRQSRLVNWNLDSEGRSLPILDNEDGDAACKSPSSLGSCPSHCGKPGQGSVCCRDDDCAAGTVCSDEECDDAGNLCDDEDCLADISPEAFPGLGEEVGGNFAMLGLGPGAKTQKQADEVAAAAALTSFAENPPFLHQPFRNLRRDSRLPPLDESYFDTFGGSSFHNSPNSSQGRILSNAQTSTFHNAFAPSFHETHGFSSDGRHHGFDPNNNMLMSPHSAGDNIFQQQQQQQQHLPDKSYLAYTSHVLNYHNPVISTADHSGSCFLNNTSLTLPPSCPLPLDQALKANDLHPACGFAIQDPLAFQQHILSEHHDLKSTLPASGPCNLDWTTADPFTPDSQSNFWNFMQDPGLLFTQLHTRQVSSSHSLENASATPSFMPTPTLSSSQDGREGFQVNERRGLGSKQEMSNFDPESPLKSLETARDSAVLLELPADLTEQPKAPCQCMWLDDKTELPCNKWFDCARALDEHCRQDHVKPMERSEGGYRCRWQMCPRRNKDHFPQRGKLNRHLQVHTGLKPNVCPYCGLAVSAKQALDQHIRLHTQETPYPCPWDGCSQRFKQRSALTMHYRTHTGEKPLYCDICGLNFRESSNLTKHRRTHDSKGIYVCEICSRDFNRLDQLRRHLNSNHKESPELVMEALRKLKPNGRQAPVQVRRNAHQQKKAVIKVMQTQAQSVPNHNTVGTEAQV